MPTVSRLGPYRLFFYSADGDEPSHIHVERDSDVAKYWLDPVRLAASGGFSRAELRDIARVVTDNEPLLLEAWHGFFAG